MVTLLTVVGLATSAFFFVSHDVYGTIVFHNFLATIGVLRALDQASRLDCFGVLQPTIMASAAVAVAALVGAHIRWLCVTTKAVPPPDIYCTRP